MTSSSSINTFSEPARSIGLSQNRHHYMDWLRSLAILLLILFHTGMVFVPWDFHIKNPQTSDAFVWWMAPLSDIRMPVLFFIAGAVSAISLNTRTRHTFVKDRLMRLGWPVIAAIFIVVPPQLWVERTYNGESFVSFWSFYQTIFDFKPYPEGNLSWHHLWFVAYLLVYCLFSALLFSRAFINAPRISHLIKNLAESPAGLLLFSLPLILIELLLYPLFPTTHALIGDWATLLYFGTIYGYGFVLTQRSEFLQTIESNRRLYLTVAMVMLALRYAHYLFPDRLPAYVAVEPVFTWVTLLAIFGYGKRYLNKRTRLSAYLSRSSYCIYILHQTWIVLLAFVIVPLDWSITAKFWFIACISLVLSVAGYEAIRNVPIFRVGFGIVQRKVKG